MLKIFVSKKEDDQLLAKRLRQELGPYLGDAVEIKMSQDIPAGEVWKDWIKEELRQTDLLLFLITDVKISLDWCIYEVGMFTPLSDREPKPIVCIYPIGQETPSQIRDVQGVECAVDPIKQFLKDLFDGSLLGQSINNKVATNDKLLLEIAENLVETLTPINISKKERVYYTRYISFDIKMPNEDADEIPAETRIAGDDLSLEVFGLDSTRPDGGRWTWKRFKGYFSKALEEADSPVEEFFKEFEQSILSSCRGEKISPSQHCIRSLTSSKKYRPVIHRRDFRGNNHFEIRVLFMQEPEPDSGDRNLTFAATPGE
jgi:hypothetical protein